MRAKKKVRAAITFTDLQKKYKLKDAALIQKRILFVNVMAIIKYMAEDNPPNRLMIQQYVNDFDIAEKARTQMAP
jgi:hypothetical protein